MKIETGKTTPDHSPTFKDIAAQVITICIEATLDDNTGADATTTGAAHNNLAPPTKDTATHLTVTHHTGCMAGHPNIEALQIINPKIADHIHAPHTDLQGMNLTDQIHTPAGWEEGHTPRRT